MKVVVHHVKGSRRGQRQEFDGPGRIRFGRHPESEVSFDAHRDLDASSRHAELVRTPEGFLLCDVGSSNGTYVAGERIGEPVALTPDVPVEIDFGAGGPRVRLWVGTGTADEDAAGTGGDGTVRTGEDDTERMAGEGGAATAAAARVGAAARDTPVTVIRRIGPRRRRAVMMIAIVVVAAAVAAALAWVALHRTRRGKAARQSGRAAPAGRMRELIPAAPGSPGSGRETPDRARDHRLDDPARPNARCRA